MEVARKLMQKGKHGINSDLHVASGREIHADWYNTIYFLHISYFNNTGEYNIYLNYNCYLKIAAITKV
jgi:hypothetical protein